MQERRLLITSALPYANGSLHFGHIVGAFLPADVYARYQRQHYPDKEVLYLCGSDEYGFAITMAAEQAGKTPQEHVDYFHIEHKAFFEKMDFSFDIFSRTTNPYHASITQKFFLDLKKQGYVEKLSSEQLYSPTQQRFLADRYVVGTCPRCQYTEARGDECGKCAASFEAIDLIHPRAKKGGEALEKRATSHWYLRLDLFKEKLSSWLATKNWKTNVVKFIQNYIQDLRPRAITRDADWGIQVPLEEGGYEEGKVFYVWFDAPIGYISIAQEWAALQHKSERWRDFWQDPDTKLVQFVGKDNIPFHAAFFPAILMGQTEFYKTVDELPANEFLLLEGRQFSKSDGWVIDTEQFFHNFTADQIRYALASIAPEGQDSEFTWKDFGEKCNTDLVGKLGNFINRVLTFLHNKNGGKIPLTEKKNAASVEEALSLFKQIKECYEQFHVRKASQLVIELASLGNRYFDHEKPWKKLENAQQEAEEVLYNCLEIIALLALAVYPLMPQAAQKIWELIGEEGKISVHNNLPPLQGGKPLPKPCLLFQKVEDSYIKQEQENLALLKAKFANED